MFRIIFIYHLNRDRAKSQGKLSLRVLLMVDSFT